MATILVDDDEELCSALGVVLSSLGCVVETTTSPLRAADLLRPLYRKLDRYGGRTSAPAERDSQRKRIEHALCELFGARSPVST